MAFWPGRPGLVYRYDQPNNLARAFHVPPVALFPQPLFPAQAPHLPPVSLLLSDWQYLKIEDLTFI